MCGGGEGCTAGWCCTGLAGKARGEDGWHMAKGTRGLHAVCPEGPGRPSSGKYVRRALLLPMGRWTPPSRARVSSCWKRMVWRPHVWCGDPSCIAVAVLTEYLGAVAIDSRYRYPGSLACWANIALLAYLCVLSRCGLPRLHPHSSPFLRAPTRPWPHLFPLPERPWLSYG